MSKVDSMPLLFDERELVFADAANAVKRVLSGDSDKLSIQCSGEDTKGIRNFIWEQVLKRHLKSELGVACALSFNFCPELLNGLPINNSYTRYLLVKRVYKQEGIEQDTFALFSGKKWELTYENLLEILQAYLLPVISAQSFNRSVMFVSSGFAVRLKEEFKQRQNSKAPIARTFPRASFLRSLKEQMNENNFAANSFVLKSQPYTSTKNGPPKRLVLELARFV